MKVIYKYKLEFKDKQVLELPKDFIPLRVDFQDGQLCLWAIVDPKKEKKNHDFYIVGTGWVRNNLDKLNYISTVFETLEMTDDDMANMKPFKQNFVWHIFYSEVQL